VQGVTGQSKDALLAAQLGDTIEFAGDAQAGEGRVHHQAQGFSREVVDPRWIWKRRPVPTVSVTRSSDRRRLRSCGMVIGARVPSNRDNFHAPAAMRALR
jgi:hypothetical protein